MKAKRKVVTAEQAIYGFTENKDLELPDFLRASSDPKVRAREAAAWDKFLASKKPDGTSNVVKMNWLKPKSMSDEDYAAYVTKQEQIKQVKLGNAKKKGPKFDPTGKRWDTNTCQWIDYKTGEPAKPVKEEVAAVRAEAKAVAQEARAKAKAECAIKQAIPSTGILAEFVCKPNTFRANLLVTFEKSLGKMVTADALCKAVYNASAKEKLGPLKMVIKGAEDTITKLKLPYELKDKDDKAWGLFKLKGKGK